MRGEKKGKMSGRAMKAQTRGVPEEPLRGQDQVRLEGPGVDFTLEEGVVRMVFMGAWAETQRGEDALALGAVEGVQPTMVWALAALAWAGVVRPAPAGVREVQEAHEAERI